MVGYSSHAWVEACIKFRPCARLDCNSQPFAIKKLSADNRLLSLRKKGARMPIFKINHFMQNKRLL